MSYAKSRVPLSQWLVDEGRRLQRKRIRELEGAAEIASLQNANYTPYGAPAKLFADTTSSEILLPGPSGTGKTRALGEWAHSLCFRFPGARGLIVRKTRVSMTQSIMVTMNTEVLTPWDGVYWHGGDSEYRYPNGSVLVVAGIDTPSRIMSTFYDFAIVVEATELTLAEWEHLLTRVRAEAMDINGKPWNPIAADCNPAGPSHWLRRRIDAGLITSYPSTHEDNPRYWDQEKQEWTPRGEQYLTTKLDRLSGVRYLRLRKGLWAAAEGMIYDEWRPEVHLIDRFDIPDDWPRIWGVDFGYTNPFVFQAWAEDPDGRIYLYKEIYHTRRLVEEHAQRIREVLVDDPVPEAIIVDHDAEDRATFERHLQFFTQAAYKRVLPGIQAVQSRLKVQGDGKPRLYIMRDSLVDLDPQLDEAAKPTSTADEIESYVWDESATTERIQREQPRKVDDHGVDTMRYVIAYLDDIAADLADEVGTSYVVYDGRVRIGPDI